MYRDGGRSGQEELVHFCVVPESEFQHQQRKRQSPGSRQPSHWSGKVLFSQYGR